MLTAIMPTMLKRRRLIPAAMRTFARQTLKDKILLVGIDMGEEEMIPLVMETGRALDIDVRVVIARADLSLGAKRNELCSAAVTKWITFWDDDDWSAPTRLERTWSACEEAEDDRISYRALNRPCLVGSKRMLIHEIVDPRRRTFEYTWQGEEPYFVGGLLCFERTLWERFPFAETGEGSTIGDEAWWQLALPQDQINRFDFTPDPSIYCAFIHKGNTANTQAPTGSKEWKLVGEIADVADPAGGSRIPILTTGSCRRYLAKVMGADELGLWEDAHASALLDPFVTDRLRRTP